MVMGSHVDPKAFPMRTLSILELNLINVEVI